MKEGIWLGKTGLILASKVLECSQMLKYLKKAQLHMMIFVSLKKPIKKKYKMQKSKEKSQKGVGKKQNWEI